MISTISLSNAIIYKGVTYGLNSTLKHTMLLEILQEISSDKKVNVQWLMFFIVIDELIFYLYINFIVYNCICS